MLNVGDIAPDFQLEVYTTTDTTTTNNNNLVSLSQFRGKKVVLYFYPRDNTPGCIKQACAFRDKHSEFQEKNIIVLGISKDSVESHKKFAEKFSLPFILLSDKELDAIQKYGVWKEKNVCGKKNMGVERTTFIIDEDGKIEKIFSKVKPEANPSEILLFLNQ